MQTAEWIKESWADLVKPENTAFLLASGAIGSDLFYEYLMELCEQAGEMVMLGLWEYQDVEWQVFIFENGSLTEQIGEIADKNGLKLWEPQEQDFAALGIPVNKNVLLINHSADHPFHYFAKNYDCMKRIENRRVRDFHNGERPALFQELREIFIPSRKGIRR
jgi:hypothetical protein